MRTGATQLEQFTPDISITINGNTYDNNESTGILRKFVEDSQFWGGKYTAILDNYDNSLDSVDFTGLSAQVYIGFAEEAGSYLPILTVEKQEQTSYRGRHSIELVLYDEIAALSLHKGSVGSSIWNYPQQSATALAEVVLPSGEPLPPDLITAISAQYDKTSLQILTAIIAATTGRTLNNVGEDGYLDTSKPLVNANDALSACYQALLGTLSYFRAKSNTTELDIIKPSGSASVYTYASTEYFFSNVVGLDVLIPNTIIYHGIDATDHKTLLETDTDGGHGVNAASFAKVGTIAEHRDYDIDSRENSGTQAEVDDKADVAITKLALGANYGVLVAPMHCSQEIGDAITIIDESYPTPKTITGYVFRIIREFDKHVYTITLHIGGVETGYIPLQGIKNFNATDYPKAGSLPFSSITTLPKAVQGYQHDITFTADSDKQVSWSSGTLKFYDGTLAYIAAGNTGELPNTILRYIYFDLADAAPTVLKVTTNYQSVMTEETGLVCIVQKSSDAGILATFLPSYGKEPLITPDFIDMTGVLAYDYGADLQIRAIYSTQISAGYLSLTADTIKNGEWYDEAGIVLDTGNGISLYGGHIALRTFADSAAYATWLAIGDVDDLTGVQCYVGTNGKIYAGAGAIYLDATGLNVVGNAVSHYYYDAATKIGTVYLSSTSYGLNTEANKKLWFFGYSGIELGTGDKAGVDFTGSSWIDLPDKADSDPTGAAGRIYYNTTSNVIRWYNGSSWATLASGSAFSGNLSDLTLNDQDWGGYDITNVDVLEARGRVQVNTGTTAVGKIGYDATYGYLISAYGSYNIYLNTTEDLTLFAGDDIALSSGGDISIASNGNVAITGTTLKFNSVGIATKAASQSDVTASRTLGTVYPNESGKPMIITITVAVGNTSAYVAGYSGATDSPSVVVTSNPGVASGYTSITFVVPPSYYYKAAYYSTVALYQWMEWTIG